MGEVSLLVTWEKDGKWEPELEVLRGTPIGGLLSVIDDGVFQHALRGYSRPLVDVLGIPPEGALRKLPDAASDCALRHTCPFHEARCKLSSKLMPWCFEPEGFSDPELRKAVTKVIEEWRGNVYVVVVRDGKASG